MGRTKSWGKYSVLMSVYYKDNPQYLELAVKSMMNQTVKPEQFVIVEDGVLTDELYHVLDEYERNNASILTRVKINNNSGLANALNVGLANCRNELVARMDADDISLSLRCEKELQFFDKYDNLAVCGCNIDEFYDSVEDIRTSRKVPSKNDEIRKFGRKRQPFNHPTVMYKKSVVQSVGGYPDLKRKEDFDLFSKIITEGFFVRNIDESLYLYRADKNNYLRRKSKENMKAAFYAYKLHRNRGGCSWIDYIEICFAEVLFYVMPLKMMRIVSDKFLRK